MSAESKRGRRGGGRAGRKQQRQREATAPAPAYITRRIPTYELLGGESLHRLEDQAEWILQEVGIQVIGDEEALATFRTGGAEVDGTRVRFERGLARELCHTAPAEFPIYARDSKTPVMIGGDNVVFAPCVGPPMVTDLDSGRRPGAFEDFVNFVKLAEASPWLHHAGGQACEPEDLPLNKRHLDMSYALLRYSGKIYQGASGSAEAAQDAIDMARLVYGEAFMAEHAVLQGDLNVNSPLTLDHISTGVLKTYARANQPVLISPFMMSGAMAPVTQPAGIAQLHAEAMATIALGQLYRPGSPAIYGNFLTTLNLKTGAPTFGTPEATLSMYAIGQLCRRLGVPLRCGGHLTASKVADAQAMQESADSMHSALMAGGQFIIQAAGWLESGMAASYEKFVMDVDHCGNLQRLLGGLTIDDEQLARDAYREAGLGGTFLGVEHTQRHFKTANYPSALCDDDSFEAWTENGSEDMLRRANKRWKQMLADYQLPEMDPAVDESLRDFVEQKKRAVPDAWH